MDADRGKKSWVSSRLSSEDRVLRRLFRDVKRLGGGSSETKRCESDEDDDKEEEEDKDEERDLERPVIESSESDSDEDSEEEDKERAKSSWKQKKYLSISGQVWSISCARDEKGVSCALGEMDGSSKRGDKGNGRGVVSIVAVVVVVVGVDGVEEDGSVDPSIHVSWTLGTVVGCSCIGAELSSTGTILVIDGCVANFSRMERSGQWCGEVST